MTVKIVIVPKGNEKSCLGVRRKSQDGIFGRAVSAANERTQVPRPVKAEDNPLGNATFFTSYFNQLASAVSEVSNFLKNQCVAKQRVSTNHLFCSHELPSMLKRIMEIIVKVLVGFIALAHIGFLVLEMFLWTKPFGLKVFKMSPELANKTATLAANQGLYNGFLAAGLLWSLFHPNENIGHSLKLFFLICVLVAGLYGWYSVGRNILFIQAIPASVALFLICTFPIR